MLKIIIFEKKKTLIFSETAEEVPPNHTPFAHALLYIHSCLVAAKTQLLIEYLSQILKCKVRRETWLFNIC